MRYFEEIHVLRQNNVKVDMLASLATMHEARLLQVNGQGSHDMIIYRIIGSHWWLSMHLPY